MRRLPHRTNVATMLPRRGLILGDADPNRRWNRRKVVTRKRLVPKVSRHHHLANSRLESSTPSLLRHSLALARSWRFRKRPGFERGRRPRSRHDSLPSPPLTAGRVVFCGVAGTPAA
jgi:hypothetical protein